MKKLYLWMLGFMVMLAASIMYFWPSNKVTLITCDVGQGDAILITHSFTQVLIDGGPDGAVLGCLGRYMPFWDREIEAVVMTHPDRDHAEGLIEVMKRYRVGSFMSSMPHESIDSLVESHETKKLTPVPNKLLQLGQLHLTVLAPLTPLSSSVDTNDASIVLYITYGKATALLMGDADRDIELALIKTYPALATQVLKVGHHGSKTSSGELFIRNIHPEIALLSVGKKNRFGHPHKDVVELLKSEQVILLRTDIAGDIRLETDGKYWRTFNRMR